MSVFRKDETEKLGIQFNGLPPGPLSVKSIAEGSCGDIRGIEEDDVLLQVGNENLQSLDDLTGDAFKAFLKARPVQMVFESNKDPYLAYADSSVAKLGITFNGMPPGQLRVKSVADGEFMAQQGVNEGDVLLRVGKTDLVSLEGLSPEDCKSYLKDRPLRLEFKSAGPSPPHSPAATPRGNEGEHKAAAAEGQESKQQEGLYEIVADATVSKMGISFNGLPPGQLRVKSVASGEFGSQQGVHEGDVLLRVGKTDLVSLEGLSAEDFKSFLKDRPLRLEFTSAAPTPAHSQAATPRAKEVSDDDRKAGDAARHTAEPAVAQAQSRLEEQAEANDHQKTTDTAPVIARESSETRDAEACEASNARPTGPTADILRKETQDKDDKTTEEKGSTEPPAASNVSEPEPAPLHAKAADESEAQSGEKELEAMQGQHAEDDKLAIAQENISEERKSSIVQASSTEGPDAGIVSAAEPAEESCDKQSPEDRPAAAIESSLKNSDGVEAASKAAPHAEVVTTPKSVARKEGENDGDERPKDQPAAAMASSLDSSDALETLKAVEPDAKAGSAEKSAEEKAGEDNGEQGQKDQPPVAIERSLQSSTTVEALNSADPDAEVVSVPKSKEEKAVDNDQGQKQEDQPAAAKESGVEVAKSAQTIEGSKSSANEEGGKREANTTDPLEASYAADKTLVPEDPQSLILSLRLQLEEAQTALAEASAALTEGKGSALGNSSELHMQLAEALGERERLTNELGKEQALRKQAIDELERRKAMPLPVRQAQQLERDLQASELALRGLQRKAEKERRILAAPPAESQLLRTEYKAEIAAAKRYRAASRQPPAPPEPTSLQRAEAAAARGMWRLEQKEASRSSKPSRPRLGR
ncbi:unnamed protein product [Durusdinium trenchii]|uniref:PDZ domain-containing protein n=1 Tax=Durusdinium trenchii TaxID=1381693 RepID=A0ABP0SDM9_9DINO